MPGSEVKVRGELVLRTQIVGEQCGGVPPHVGAKGDRSRAGPNPTQPGVTRSGIQARAKRRRRRRSSSPGAFEMQGRATA